MTVRELIKALKKMPQDLTVGVQDHDSSEFEISSIPQCVYHWEKFKLDDLPRCKDDIARLESEPDECVIIRC